MKIEIATPGRMVQSGHSLLRLLQDNDTPVLDLLVREAVQNSLDAADPKKRFVNLEFLTGTFVPAKLNHELEGVEEKLNRRFPSNAADFLAIKDWNTTGLTGPLHYEDVKDDNYGNLLKLIYEISKEQDKSGSGGAWGLGKTVYFRLGIGLVLYYSRILEDGVYKSRMAACMVEVENSPDAVIPQYKNLTKRGIAWWGAPRGNEENKTIPLQDEEEINRILETFGMAPYSGKETGTTVIIPYINKEELLKNNLPTHEEVDVEAGKLSSGNLPYWFNSLEDYLKIALQRWYAPRLDNEYYATDNRKYLKAWINGKELKTEQFDPQFKIIQGLYNRTITDEPLVDYISKNGIEVFKEPINLRGGLKKQEAGNVCYGRFSREDLIMTPPHNRPAPEAYFGLNPVHEGVNAPIFAYSRQPGMVVSYENDGRWVHGISPTRPDEYLIGFFSLNSDNTLKGGDGSTTLEEYIRAGEKANHRMWEDHQEGKANPKIVYRIQKNVAKKISDRYKAVKTELEGKVNTAVGTLLADALLPPEGFGTGPTPEPPGKKPSKSSPSKTLKRLEFRINEDNILYTPDGMVLDALLNARSQTERLGFSSEIRTDNGFLSLETWKKEIGQEPPFSVNEVQIRFKNYDKKSLNAKFKLNDEIEETTYKDLTIKLSKDESGYFYGMSVTSDTPHSYEMALTIDLKINRRDVEPSLKMER